MTKGTAVFLACLLFFPGRQALASGHAKGKAGRQARTADTRITKMKAAGTVTEISLTVLRIQRTVKGKREAMEFFLKKPAAKIMVGDKVQVSYVTRENRNVATNVAKIVVRKTSPKTTIRAKPSGKPLQTAPAAP